MRLMVAALNNVHQIFQNWWVASRFVLGREKFLKCNFFQCIKIKNRYKWESEKRTKLEKGEE
jgi:hypothetical protein